MVKSKKEIELMLEVMESSLEKIKNKTSPKNICQRVIFESKIQVLNWILNK